MADERTSVSTKEFVRDELRRYKSRNGLTYTRQSLACLRILTGSTTNLLS